MHRPAAEPGATERLHDHVHSSGESGAIRVELARLAGDGSLRVFVSQTFPLADVADAHRAIMDGHVTGKIALIP